MIVKLNRREKYQVNLVFPDNCPGWYHNIQTIIDNTWNKFINWNPLLKDVIKLNESDTWSVDYTLAKVAVPLLIQLKETNHGYGYIEDEDVPEELKTGNNDHNKDKFDWYMDEIIWCLTEIATDEQNSPDVNIPTERIFLNKDELTAEENKELKEWLKLQEEYEERLQNGCRLFGRYYRSLWD